MVYVLNIAYLFMLIALAVRNILILRIVLISAQTVFIVYGIVTGNVVVLTWNSIFFAINVFQVVVLFRRRRPVEIPWDLRDVYEKTFPEMTKRQFMYFWQTGTRSVISPGIVIRQGSKQNQVLLILAGKAYVKSAGRDVGQLTRGSFVAEMSFLTGEPASANVVCYGPLTCASWNHENLHGLKEINYDLWIKLQHVLSKDLIGKVKRTTTRLHDVNE